MESKNIFEVFMWPEVKYYFSMPGFVDNSVPILDKPLIDEYGGSAWLVRRSWIEDMKQGKIPYTYE
jgi:hypothetical protein